MRAVPVEWLFQLNDKERAGSQPAKTLQNSLRYLPLQMSQFEPTQIFMPEIDSRFLGLSFISFLSFLRSIVDVTARKQIFYYLVLTDVECSQLWWSWLLTFDSWP